MSLSVISRVGQFGNFSISIAQNNDMMVLLCALCGNTYIVLLLTRLNGKNVAFGQVIDGMDIIKVMETQGSQNGQLVSEVVIEGCGVL